jgi:UDP-N-acetyl-D-mannosaminuronic acid transferase (WecB/TagA/CpsF family)
LSPIEPGLLKAEMLASPVIPGLAGEMVRIIASCQSEGLSVFFFGSEAWIVYMLLDRVGADFPAVKIAGICDADFGGFASPAIVDFIADAKPGVILLDMAHREARLFSQANGHRFARASIFHLDGAFDDYVLSRGARGRLSRAVWRSRSALLPRRALRQGLSALRFSSVMLSQLLQGIMSRVRVVGCGAAMRRD